MSEYLNGKITKVILRIIFSLIERKEGNKIYRKFFMIVTHKYIILSRLRSTMVPYVLVGDMPIVEFKYYRIMISLTVSY